MSTEKAQQRLEKLKSHIKNERAAKSVKTETVAARSLVGKLKKKDKIRVGNPPGEKKCNRNSHEFSQADTKPSGDSAIPNISRKRPMSDLAASSNDPVPKKNTAQLRLKKVARRKKMQLDSSEGPLRPNASAKHAEEEGCPSVPDKHKIRTLHSTEDKGCPSVPDKYKISTLHSTEDKRYPSVPEKYKISTLRNTEGIEYPISGRIMSSSAIPSNEPGAQKNSVQSRLQKVAVRKKTHVGCPVAPNASTKRDQEGIKKVGEEKGHPSVPDKCKIISVPSTEDKGCPPSTQNYRIPKKAANPEPAPFSFRPPLMRSSSTSSSYQSKENTVQVPIQNAPPRPRAAHMPSQNLPPGPKSTNFSTQGAHTQLKPAQSFNAPLQSRLAHVPSQTSSHSQDQPRTAHVPSQNSSHSQDQPRTAHVPSQNSSHSQDHPRTVHIPNQNVRAHSNPANSFGAPPKTDPPQVQRNLFKRKPHGSDNNVSTMSRANPIASNNDPPNSDGYNPKVSHNEVPPEYGQSKFKQFFHKTCERVVEAVKGTWSMGSDRISSYGFSRPNVSKQLQDVRTLVESVEMMDYEISSPTFEIEPGPLTEMDLHLVIDTNIVIDSLPLIKSLKFKKVKGMTPKVIIPWQVLKELDYLKEERRLDALHSNNARSGIRFLLNEIVQNGGFVSGQPQHVASRSVDFTVEVPDDHLIKCCLQLQWTGHSVMLLTNDKNLVVKAVVSDVMAMRCDEFSKICKESDQPRTFTCFENPPFGTFPAHQLANANSAHRLAVLLREFLSSVLKKYWILKYRNVWRLGSPGAEPWPLTSLLETACEVWNEIATAEARSSTLDVILFLRRFIHKVSYERVRYSDLDHLGRACHQLAMSLPATFGVEGISCDLAFLKCPEGADPPAGTTFIDSCISLTMHHFQLFENKVVQYCYGLSQSTGVPFSYPKSIESVQRPAHLSELSYHLETVRCIGDALVKISSTPSMEITRTSDVVRNLHYRLVSYLKETADPRFVLEDVVEFCMNENMRKSFPFALQNLQTLTSFLETFNRRR